MLCMRAHVREIGFPSRIENDLDAELVDHRLHELLSLRAVFLPVGQVVDHLWSRAVIMSSLSKRSSLSRSAPSSASSSST
jgi:hypothetical protein